MGSMAFAVLPIILPVLFFFRLFFFSLKRKSDKRNPYYTVKNRNSVRERWVSPAFTVGWGQAGWWGASG